MRSIKRKTKIEKKKISASNSRARKKKKREINDFSLPSIIKLKNLGCFHFDFIEIFCHSHVFCGCSL